MYQQSFTPYQNKTFETLQHFSKENFNIELLFNSFKVKNYFSYKNPIPNDLKSFLVYINLLVLAVFLAILVKLVIILKLGLRSISKRIRSIIFLNIYTLSRYALTHIIIFVSK